MTDAFSTPAPQPNPDDASNPSSNTNPATPPPLPNQPYGWAPNQAPPFQSSSQSAPNQSNSNQWSQGPAGSPPPPPPPNSPYTIPSWQNPSAAIYPNLSPGDKTYAAIMHASILLLPVILPLILWLIRRNENKFFDDHGREALNHQITMALYYIIAVVLSVITCGVAGFVLVPALIVFGLVVLILAIVAAADGRFYRYPICLRLV